MIGEKMIGEKMSSAGLKGEGGLRGDFRRGRGRRLVSVDCACLALVLWRVFYFTVRTSLRHACVHVGCSYRTMYYRLRRLEEAGLVVRVGWRVFPIGVLRDAVGRFFRVPRVPMKRARKVDGKYVAEIVAWIVYCPRCHNAMASRVGVKRKKCHGCGCRFKVYGTGRWRAFRGTLEELERILAVARFNRSPVFLRTEGFTSALNVYEAWLRNEKPVTERRVMVSDEDVRWSWRTVGSR